MRSLFIVLIFDTRAPSSTSQVTPSKSATCTSTLEFFTRHASFGLGLAMNWILRRWRIAAHLRHSEEALIPNAFKLSTRVVKDCDAAFDGFCKRYGDGESRYNDLSSTPEIRYSNTL